MSYTDSMTGEPIDGKAYILKSTDGEEVTDPKRLFLADRLAALEDRVAALEAAATPAPAPADGGTTTDPAPADDITSAPGV